MKKAFFGLMALMLLATIMLPVMAKPPSGRKGKSNNASVLLVPKSLPDYNPLWPDDLYGTGTTFGEIKYRQIYNGDFEARLKLHGLKPNNWYLVTFQAGSWWSGSDIPDDAKGIFGHKVADIEWIDVALVKTNDEGNVNAIIPTTSGLTADDLVISEIQTDLTDGDYKVAVVVKDVGYDPNTGGPNLGTLLQGGKAVLYEMDLMAFTIE